MPRYRITVSGDSREAMADLIRKYHLQVFDHGVRHNRETGYTVDALAEPDEIETLKTAGYQIRQHEDVDEAGKARQKEVGRGNRYENPIPRKSGK